MIHLAWYWLVVFVALGWFLASYFALKGYNVLSYILSAERYSAQEFIGFMKAENTRLHAELNDAKTKLEALARFASGSKAKGKQ